MARPKSMPIRETLSRLFGAAYLRQVAKGTGVVRRNRKVDARDLFWTLVLGFSLGNQRTLAGLRRSYEKTTGQSLVPSSFYKRFTPELARMLKLALARALKVGLEITRSLEGPLAEFRDLVLADSSVLRLHDLLTRKYPATRTPQVQAAAKLHTVISVRGAGDCSVKMTSERTPEGQVFHIGPWVRGHLLIFDLGFYRYQLFSRISGHGGYLLSRLKNGVNPRIVAVNRAHRGRALDLVGRKLSEVKDSLKREIADVEVEVDFHRRGYRGSRRGATQRLRVIGIRNEETGRYHFYISNIPVDKLAAEDIAAVYAARWMIELLFKELKTYYRLDQLPSSKSYIVEALIYASLISLVVSRRLAQAVRQKLGRSADRVRAHRWAAIFQAVSVDLLVLMVRAPRETGLIARLLVDTILREAVDPNAQRQGLIRSIETRSHALSRKTA